MLSNKEVADGEIIPGNIYFRRNRPVANRVRASVETKDDGFSAYRLMCESRMRHLERYKKCRSYCSLGDATQLCRSTSLLGSEGARSVGYSVSDRRKSIGHLMTHHEDAVLCTTEQHLPPSARPRPCSQYFFSSTNDLIFNTALHYEEEAATSKVPLHRNFLLGYTNFVVDSEGEAAIAGVALHSDEQPMECVNTGCDCAASSTKAAITSSPGAKPLLKAFSCEGGEVPSTMTSQCSSTLKRSDSDGHTVANQFEVLREKMISLMENDVQLLRKLVTLGEKIKDLRTNQQKANGSESDSLASDGECDSQGTHSPGGESIEPPFFCDSDETAADDTLQWVEKDGQRRTTSVTTLYVGDEQSPSMCPRIQYFSRKNSVLRIPIPPRSSNRAARGRIQRRYAYGPNDISLLTAGRSTHNKCVSAPFMVEEEEGDINVSSSEDTPSPIFPYEQPLPSPPGGVDTPVHLSAAGYMASGVDSGRTTLSSSNGSCHSTFSSISSGFSSPAKDQAEEECLIVGVPMAQKEKQNTCTIPEDNEYKPADLPDCS